MHDDPAGVRIGCLPIPVWCPMLFGTVQEILSAEATTEPKESMEEVNEDASLQEQNVMLDWKGDPMVVNPGDKLPFNFR